METLIKKKREVNQLKLLTQTVSLFSTTELAEAQVCRGNAQRRVKLVRV